MAECYVCKRSAVSGNSRSHSNIASKRKFKINLQDRKIDGTKRKVCARCIKTMSKEK